MDSPRRYEQLSESDNAQPIPNMSLIRSSITSFPHSFPLQDHELPTATVDVIVAACERAPSVTKKGARVRRISENAVVKVSEFICLSEARTMNLVAARTSVRVPKLIRSFEVPINEESKITYIVMEYIHGQLLADCWNDMGESQRQSVCDQVVKAIGELQLLELGQPGPVGGGVSNGRWFTRYGAGPFKTVDELENWYTHKFDVCKKCNQAHQDETPFAGKFGRMVMSHMDIAPRNIVLEKDGKICLIDWGFAGAYPVYFERAGLLAQHYFPDFSERILANMKPYEEEIKALKSIVWALEVAPLS